jgi:mRNA interferase YafQ
MANIDVKITATMKQDLKRVAKRGKDVLKLHTIVELLLQRKRLAARFKDHALTGMWKGYRECHIEPDWLLIYKMKVDLLYLARTGTHADLFKM